MGTGYTRNDTANNIADGNVINASDLDGEFDAIQAAFNASTGHSHDGTTGEGPQIGTGGIADNAVTLGTKTAGNYVATGAVSGVGLSGSASAEGATFTVTSNATDANTGSTIVARDASGNFSAGTITASLTGTASNAALLDSLDSTQFLRSDAADTKTSGDLSFADNVKAQFGASNDLQIWHNSTGGYSIIRDAGTGDLYIEGSANIRLRDPDGRQSATFIPNGSQTFYHANSPKLATTSGGIDVTGTVTFDGGTTSADLNFGDNDKAVFGAGSDLQIYHDGLNSYITDVGTGSLRIHAENFYVDNADASKRYFKGTNGAEVAIYYNGSEKLATTSTGVDVTGTITFDGGTTSSDLNFGDNNKALFGAGSDLQIYHDGSHSIIKDNGTGNLYIDGSSTINFRSGDGGEYYAVFNDDGAVSLRYNNVVKFATKSDGVDITGELQSDSLDVDGNADIAGTLAVGGHIDVPDNIKMRFGASDDLQIYHDGSNSYIHDYGTGSLYIDATQLNFRNGAQTATYADFTNGGGARLMHNGNVKFETVGGGVQVTGYVQADSLYLGDNERAYFGAGNDLQIYHNSSNGNSYITEGGSGSLVINGDNLYLQNAAGTENYVSCNANGSVDLYYNNAVKLQTTNTGIDISGNINAVDNIYLAGAIYHEGDTNTYMQFQSADTWRVVTGGTAMLTVNNDTVNLTANSVGSVQTTNVNTNATPDLYTYNTFVWTLIGNTALNNPSTEVAGMSGVFIFIQDGTGNRTLSLGTDWETAGGAGITLSTAPNAVDIVPYYVQSSGNILLGTPQLAFA